MRIRGSEDNCGGAEQPRHLARAMRISRELSGSIERR